MKKNLRRPFFASVAFAVLVWVAAGGGFVEAQQSGGAIYINNGTIGTGGGAVGVTKLPGGVNICSIAVGNTAWTGTLNVQGGPNFANLTTIYPYGSTTSQANITANGLYQVTVSALTQVQVAGPTSTGTATVNIACTAVGGQSQMSLGTVTIPTPLSVTFPSAQPVTATVTIPTPLAISTPAAGVPLAVTTPLPVPTNAAGQVLVAVASPAALTVNTPAPLPTISPGLLPGVIEACPTSTPLYNGIQVASCDTSGDRNVRIGAVASPVPVVASSSVPVTTAVIPNVTGFVNLASASNIKTAAGTLYSLSCFNTQASTVAFVQVFNALAVNVTLGSTTPVLQQMVTASDTRPFYIPPTTGVAFSTAISIASTTTASGATGSSAGVYCYAAYL